MASLSSFPSSLDLEGASNCEWSPPESLAVFPCDENHKQLRFFRHFSTKSGGDLRLRLLVLSGVYACAPRTQHLHGQNGVVHDAPSKRPHAGSRLVAFLLMILVHQCFGAVTISTCTGRSGCAWNMLRCNDVSIKSQDPQITLVCHAGLAGKRHNGKQQHPIDQHVCITEVVSQNPHPSCASHRKLLPLQSGAWCLAPNT